MEVEPLNSTTNPAFSFINHNEFRLAEEVPGPQEVAAQMAKNEAERRETGAPVSPGGYPSGAAAMKVQKVYRSYRTRRMLADSAVVAEELCYSVSLCLSIVLLLSTVNMILISWWKSKVASAGFCTIKSQHNLVFQLLEARDSCVEVESCWFECFQGRQGLSKDAKAQKLAFQHWIEAIDPRHRYGHSLHFYYEEWCKTNSGQPFFYWLDLGDGKEVDLKECPRAKLRKQCIKYLGPQEREHYEFVVVDGKILHKLTGTPLDTSKGSPGSKWIFVMSTSKKLYTAECISAYSGHYKPTDDSLDSFLSFLKENGVNLVEVEVNEDYDANESGKLAEDGSTSEVPSALDSSPCDLRSEKEEPSSEKPETPQPKTTTEYKRTLSGGLQSPRADVSKTVILQRINSKKAAKSYQLGHKLSIKWSTGAGPRIGCIADYPVELRLQALEFTNISPRACAPVSTPRPIPALDSLLSPSSQQQRSS
ncbi:UNVERIFIED_CONTAM: IQ domain-containing protein IQM3 [Sesamum radiatum]|uniref:IQ domain-containing protein IQM3 n=1 Tax=Sesamum radiatum TaxID=300843 RepID=A0AAW2NMR6_SESRA